MKQINKIILGMMIAGLSTMSFAEETTGGVSVGGNVVPACAVTPPNMTVDFGLNSGPSVPTGSLSITVSCPENTAYTIESSDVLAWPGATNTIISVYTDSNFTQSFASNAIGAVSTNTPDNYTLYFAVSGITGTTELPAGGTSTKLKSVTESGTISNTTTLRISF